MHRVPAVSLSFLVAVGLAGVAACVGDDPAGGGSPGVGSSGQSDSGPSSSGAGSGATSSGQLADGGSDAALDYCTAQLAAAAFFCEDFEDQNSVLATSAGGPWTEVITEEGTATLDTALGSDSEQSAYAVYNDAAAAFAGVGWQKTTVGASRSKFQMVFDARFEFTAWNVDNDNIVLAALTLEGLAAKMFYIDVQRHLDGWRINAGGATKAIAPLAAGTWHNFDFTYDATEFPKVTVTAVIDGVTYQPLIAIDSSKPVSFTRSVASLAVNTIGSSPSAQVHYDNVALFTN